MKSPIPMWATPIPVFLAKCSIAVNPVVYIFLTKRYRQDFLSLWSKCSKALGKQTRTGGDSDNARKTENYTYVNFEKQGNNIQLKDDESMATTSFNFLYQGSRLQSNKTHINCGIPVKTDTSNCSDDGSEDEYVKTSVVAVALCVPTTAERALLTNDDEIQI